MARYVYIFDDFRIGVLPEGSMPAAGDLDAVREGVLNILEITDKCNVFELTGNGAAAILSKKVHELRLSERGSGAGDDPYHYIRDDA